jgi:hypothetical protein
MANHNKKVQSLIEGLSDFWLLYFKDINQLKTLYTGTEILLGQSYLDMLSLLMNNSVQDAPLFNKEYFKLIQINETETRYSQRANSSLNRYVYLAEDNLVHARVLHNKIFSVTASLEQNIDYEFNDTTRSFEFKYDPLNAYLQRTFGTGNTEFTLRTRDPLTTLFTVQLLDDGTSPFTFTLNTAADALVIAYDGPANGSTTLTRNIVTSINTHPLFSGLLFATLTDDDKGYGSPAGTAALPLLRTHVNPLDSYPTRLLAVSFGGSFINSTIPDWSDPTLAIQKGDILRLLTSPTVGTPLEFDISLVKPEALYLEVNGAITATKAASKLEFSILREPSNNTVTGEAAAISGSIEQLGVNGVITAATRVFTAATAIFSPIYIGDIIELQGLDNTGYARIIGYNSVTSVTLALISPVDEASITWNLWTTTPGTVYTDGVFTNNGDGTALFSSASATFASVEGTVIKLVRSGVLYKYAIIARLSGTQVTVSAPVGDADGVTMTWAWANGFAATTYLAYPQVKKGTVLNAKRLLDDSAVVEGIDYTLLEDAATIMPKTVWRTDLELTVDYSFRLVVLSNNAILQTGVTGVLTYGVINAFSASTASFTYQHIGQAITISNSGYPVNTPNNNGTYIISAVLTATSVQLTTDRAVLSTVDPNNGSLIWQLKRRGVLATEAITRTVQEAAFWAPDVLVDRFQLYTTFGYLINRYDRSSEEYRSLIRGVFQLFMLGPTLERFESAVNTVAGLPVVRDNGELLISYETDSYATGTDGYLNGAAYKFTAVSGAFTPDTVSDFLFISSGLNENRSFKIVQVINSTTLLLDASPTTEGPVNWELSVNALQTLTTSKQTYTFARSIPLRAAVTDPTNVGVKIFRAFEVLTDVFTVTDYVETPTWWERIRIPENLWVDEDGLRRQSSPSLVENIISPSDDARIGDPGFLIGADSQGFVPPSVVQRVGAFAGNLIGDIHYPVTNVVYFETTNIADALFTAADLDNYVVITAGGVELRRFRILGIVSNSKVLIEAFVNTPSETILAGDWQVESRPLVLRHRAAFVILDQWLKYHMFFVSFDPALLGQLGAELLADLQTLVFVAKPAYTYIVLSPSSLFKEVVQIDEELTGPDASLIPSGSAGEVIAGNESPLLVIGSSWRIGNWFRYVQNTSTFAAPTASVPNILGAPTAGYQHHASKVAVAPTFVDSALGLPIPYTKFVERVVTSGTGAILSGTGVDRQINVGTNIFYQYHLGAIIRVTGATYPINDKDYNIGRIITPAIAVLGQLHNGAGLANWQLITTGSTEGYLRVSVDGETLFTDNNGSHVFNTADVGTYVRFVYTSNVENKAMRVSYVSANGVTSCKLAKLNRVFPIVGDPDATGAVTANTLTVAAALFTADMCYNQRLIADAATANKNKYYVVFTTGVNSGQRRQLLNHNSALAVTVAGATLTTDAAVGFYVEAEYAYTVVTETSAWEHISNAIVLNENTLDLSNTPTQAVVAAVSYTAYGVREPIDPSLQVFDATNGDTYYSIGMPDPRPKQGRSRSARDTDLREDPIQIKRT